MSRPVNPLTKYKVIVHTIGSHRYASTKVNTIDDNGKTKSMHKHWGTLDEDNRFHPNTTFLYESLEERGKLIFPEDWDLSELGTIPGTRRRGRISYDRDDVDRQYGTTWLLDKVAEKTGLKKDLNTVFGNNGQMVNDILTLAYYPFIDNASYNQLSRWQREVKAPSERKLTSTEITRLSQRITEAHRMELFRRRAARLGKDELCAVDSTSISTYGFNLVDIRWGKNKERLPLRQTLEVVVYSLTSHIPIYYKELPGNMPDSRTIDLILKELRDAGFKNLVLITDRGYDSMKNIERYVALGQKVITSVKVGKGDVLEKIRGIDMSHGYPMGMEVSKASRLYYRQYALELSVKGNGGNIIKADRYRLNLYFDPIRRADGVLELQNAIREQSDAAEADIRNGTEIIDCREVRSRYNLLNLKLDESGKHILSYSVNRDKVDRMQSAYGFFANKTIGLDFDAMQAMDNYGMRDEQEKMIALQKGALHQDRLRVWSESSKHGRMFICFVGLILASYVKSVWEGDEYLRRKFDSVESVLAEMRTIRCIEHNGRMKFVTPFVGDQVKICEAFGFEIPEDCAPKYTSKTVSGKRGPGRPRKPKIENQEL